jgi:hypothetical protein
MKLNINIRKLNARLPRGKHISLLYPQRAGKKKNEQHLDLNASEAFLYICHVHTLIAPLLTERGRSDPTWTSLLALTAVVQKVLQHSFDDGEADELAVLIEAHRVAFENVPHYNDLDRPKHHFQVHLPAALRDFGPLRGFWCMPFEAFIQARANFTF